ncbi:OLC1v1019140C1 [Oldenlandia corymbosa var. corymbosa]|uniref:OLC1v1019140C1 n=1 Tax=Oldenlandia corymbosa var. corymbosa TaxID=529605 RepID=A0AAV1EDC6_OLDCO|nr:OLC1v1019140C1 [Oldenlandia corymbosa var. corymbosa]
MDKYGDENLVYHWRKLHTVMLDFTAPTLPGLMLGPFLRHWKRPVFVCAKSLDEGDFVVSGPDRQIPPSEPLLEVFSIESGFCRCENKVLNKRLSECFGGYVPKKIKLDIAIGMYEVLMANCDNGEVNLFGRNLFRCAREIGITWRSRVYFQYIGNDTMTCTNFGVYGFQSVLPTPFTPFLLRCSFRVNDDSFECFSVVPTSFVQSITMAKTEFVIVQFGGSNYEFRWDSDLTSTGFRGFHWRNFISFHKLNGRHTCLLTYVYETSILLDIFYDHGFDIIVLIVTLRWIRE